MFLRMKFLALTCYKGAYKYMYLCKGETGKGNTCILRLAVEVNIIPAGFNDPTHIFGVYTCILDCGYGLASHIC